MDDTKVIAKLQTLVEVLGSQKVAAISLGISTQYLNDLLRGRRNVSEEIASKLGFTAEWVANDERLLTPRAPDKPP